ncbi:MAG TPA: DUF3500 domain-containing protein [Methylomirabilota bacterium]|nr:DUF3500 domain-containing protein [Methylomirabilota bacterium]
MKPIPFIAAIALLLAAPLARAHSVAEEMTDSAKAFLQSLTDAQKQKATFELKDDERLNWHFVPKERKGLPLGEMTPAQRHLAYGLLNSGLSHRGYFKATTIMSLEQILHDIEQNRGPKRDPEAYFVSIFGTPSAKEPWAWRVEGHHLSLNFTVTKDKVAAAAPSFMGTNPAEVLSGPRKGLRVLGNEEDLGRKLVTALDEKQRKVAIYTTEAPKDIITGADRKAKHLEPVGLKMSDMNKSQQELLTALIREYAVRARPELGEETMKEILAAGPEKVTFAWAGPIEKAENNGHYYRVQGPGFLIEYDNVQNNANHVHAVWRDLKNDFGEDILRKHYEQNKH